MHVALVISSLSSGGAERVLSLMANYWAERGWQVTIVTLSDCGNDFYALDTRIRRVGLNVLKPSANPWQSLRNSLDRIISLRRTLLELAPQVVISFMDLTNILTLMAAAGSGIPVVISERIDPAYADLGRLRNWLRQRLYPRAAAAVVLQTGRVREWAAAFVPAHRLHVIANPVTTAEQSKGSNDAVVLPGRTVLAVGRLTEQKGFDLLIRAFAATKHDDWSLLILGEGEQQPQLQALIDSLGMERQIFLKGRVTNVQQYLRKAKLFVLSSRHEGFPNALLEAMSAGLPVIGYDCPSGPAEIICHEENGLLVQAGDVEGLAAALDRLMDDEALRSRLGNAARAVQERFAIDRIMKQWQKIINNVVTV